MTAFTSGANGVGTTTICGRLTAVEVDPPVPPVCEPLEAPPVDVIGLDVGTGVEVGAGVEVGSGVELGVGVGVGMPPPLPPWLPPPVGLGVGVGVAVGVGVGLAHPRRGWWQVGAGVALDVGVGQGVGAAAAATPDTPASMSAKTPGSSARAARALGRRLGVILPMTFALIDVIQLSS